MEAGLARIIPVQSSGGYLGMSLAALITELPAQLGQIFYTIVLPILLIVGIGWIIQRKLGLEMTTLRRLNFYFVMPAIIYYSLVTSSLTAGIVGKVVGFALACLCIQGALTYAAARVRGLAPDLRRAMMMTTMFHNSGNYGLPLQDLAFDPVGRGGDARGCQVFVMVTQNLVSFTAGILIVSGGKKGRHWRENLLHILKFPPLYAITAALVTVLIGRWLGEAAPGVADKLAPLWTVVERVKDAFIAVALLTLGAQLALVTRQKHKYPVKLSVILRLLCGPAIALAVIYVMLHTVGISSFVAQVLLISSATPTAVNCMLLCLEFENHPDFAARAVFYSTLLSPITVTLTILLAQGKFLPGF